MNRFYQVSINRFFLIDRNGKGHLSTSAGACFQWAIPLRLIRHNLSWQLFHNFVFPEDCITWFYIKQCTCQSKLHLDKSFTFFSAISKVSTREEEEEDFVSHLLANQTNNNKQWKHCKEWQSIGFAL